MPGVVRPRGRLFWKYVVLFALLVSAALLTSGLVELYFSYRENLAALVALERAGGRRCGAHRGLHPGHRAPGGMGEPGAARHSPDGRAAALRVHPPPAPGPLGHRGEPARPGGKGAAPRLAARHGRRREQTDFSGRPGSREARPGRPYFGPVYFRKESEPYLTLSVAGGGDAGVTVAEVNLKFIWDVVSQIRIGTTGRAYVVDGRGQLVAHPDISLVLQKTDLSRLEQVQAALAGRRRRARRPARSRSRRTPAGARSSRPRPASRPRLVGLRRAAARGSARAPLRVRIPHHRAPSRRRRALRAGEPAARPAHDDADPRARGRCRPDRSGRLDQRIDVNGRRA